MSATRHRSDGHEEIVALDALPLSAAIRRRELSCREVMQAYLAQIERFNPRVNAIVSLQAESRLLAQADERDRQLARGEWLGWMHGMPQAIKDLAATSGIPTTLGSPLFAGQVPEHDAIVVERVKSSGAIVIGKTNVPEFGLGSQTYNPLFGTTRNAYDPARIAGGSSGGAAVALALRMLPVADGSDMMGSLRNPAAYNNVYGFRPSQGRVPHDPQAELFVQQLATEGPMGRSVADLARLLATQAGYDPRCPLSLRDDPRRFADDLGRDFRGARLGWLGDYAGYLPMEEGVLELRSRAGRFRRAGLRGRGVPAGLSPGAPVAHLAGPSPVAGAGLAWRALRRSRTARPAQAGGAVEVESGLGLGATEVYRASLDRSDWYRALARLFERYDFLLLPSAQVFPFDAETAWPRQVAGGRWTPITAGWRW
ncbi:amidase [Pseudomonas aeruginosa]